MKNLNKIFWFLTSVMVFIGGCRTTSPEIIPSRGPDNVVIARLKDEITQPGISEAGQSWLWWYVPVAIVVIIWSIRSIFKKNEKP